MTENVIDTLKSKQEDGNEVNVYPVTVAKAVYTEEGDTIEDRVPFRFGITADGQYGYYKDGADTVTPFKSGGGGEPTFKSTIDQKMNYIDITEDSRFSIQQGSYPWGYRNDLTRSGFIPFASYKNLPDKSTSSVTITIFLEKETTFLVNYGASSEANLDILTIKFNGDTFNTLSGENAYWYTKILTLSPGTNTFQLQYSKDSSVAKGKDMGMIMFFEEV